MPDWAGKAAVGGFVTAYSLNRKSRGPRRGWNGRVFATRVFASLCAIGLVGAFAIAALWPPDMDLGTMLLAIDPHSIAALHQFTLAHGSSVIWKRAVLPFLQRPGWMLPLMGGLVAGGIAFSLNHAGPTRQSTRRSG